MTYKEKRESVIDLIIFKNFNETFVGLSKDKSKGTHLLVFLLISPLVFLINKVSKSIFHKKFIAFVIACKQDRIFTK